MIHIGVLPRQEPGVSAADVEAWIRVQRSIAQRQSAMPSGTGDAARDSGRMMLARSV